MSDDPKHQDEASRVTAEREEAGRLYREALAAVDRAVPNLVPPPPATVSAKGGRPVSPDQPVLPHEPGSLGRLLARVQGRFRAIIGRMASYALSTTEQVPALARFHHDIIQYMQRVSPLVETNHRHQMMVESGLAGYIEEVSAESSLRWEATRTRERRLVAAIDEIRTSIATVHQTGATLKRELERLLAAAPVSPSTGVNASADRDLPFELSVRPAAQPDAVNAYKYVGFEDKFRGSESDVRERMADYLPLFGGAADVLDLGCGRGEFLAALRELGISGRGIDINHEMVELCRSRGLVVDEGDGLSYLEKLRDGALGGLFAAQVVEHLQPGYLTRLLDVAFLALRPGSKIVLETLNPACWSAFFDSYIRDITHVWPLHPETLSYLVTAAGFQRVEIRYMAPYSPDHKLQHVDVARDIPLTPTQAAMIETFNANVDLLNGQLFSNRDYAVIAERL